MSNEMNEEQLMDMEMFMERERLEYEAMQDELAAKHAWREMMTAKYPDTPLVAVRTSAYDRRYYGPFPNGATAMAWHAIQPQTVRFDFIPLRYPWLKREANDFYSLETDETLHNSPEYMHENRGQEHNA